MSIAIEVWGDYAMFTNPAFKAERLSYDMMTPSAARGLIESILWHPGMVWRIDKIWVCAPIRFQNIRRNEVKSKVSGDKAQSMMKKGKGSFYLATPEDIQQRASMMLRDVHYVIEAHFEMTDKASPSDNPGKFQEMVRRRVEKGQFYHQPCFGVRECPAQFRLCKEIPPCPEELEGTRDLGWMLYDMDYSDPEDIQPRFFRAVLHDGVLTVPPWNSKEVHG